MEWIKARGALKSSFFSEISMLSATHQHDDVFGLAANATCDDFSVDDLLDFSDKNFEENSFQEEDDEGKGSFSESSQERSFVYNQEFGALPEGELAVPVDDIENLEWLSHFVDDSIMEVSLLCQGGNFKEKNICFVKKQSEVITRESYFSSPVCRKPRGKRARPSGSVVWRVGSPSSTSEASMSSSSHGISLVSSCVLDSIEENDSLFSIEKPPCKKYKKKTNGDTDYGTCVSQMLRRCTHCQVQKTPQWRTGPLGPKTLCNACGVRFKSGRLFPEYRPACSPTFSQEVHSNSHKKVLEMREKKEMVIIPDDSLPSSCCSLDSNLISV